MIYLMIPSLMSTEDKDYKKSIPVQRGNRTEHQKLIYMPREETYPQVQ